MDTDCGAAADSAADDRFNLQRKIFVGNISYRVKQHQISKHFSQFGPVDYCYIVKDHLRKLPRGIAFVTFHDKSGMMKALQATNEQLILDDRQMRVAPAEESKRVSYVEGSDWQPLAPGPVTAAPITETPSLDVLSQIGRVVVDLSTLELTSCETCLIERLCDDSLILVFSFLSVSERVRIERVCRRWRHLAQKAWNRQHHLQFRHMFRCFMEGLTDTILNHLLLRCGVYLRSLDLSASPPHLTDLCADSIGANCPNLVGLNVSGVSLTEVSLRTIAQKCSKLTKFVQERSFYVGDKGLTWLFQGCPLLEHIDVRGNASIVGDCFHSVSTNLRSLTLDHCVKLTDLGVRKICLRCRQLTELSISECKCLTDQSLVNISQNLKRLKVLHMEGSYLHVTISGLKKIGELVCLRELSLSKNSTVNDDVLIQCAVGCPNLAHVDISGCYKGVTDIGIQSLTRCSDLAHLNISYLSKVSDIGVESLARNGRLQTLIARACPGVTDQAIMTLADLCLDLDLVDLSGCFSICNNSVERFIAVHMGADTKPLTLVLGGTSVEPEALDTTGTNILINMYNLSMIHLSVDRDIMLRPADSSSEEEEEPEAEVSHDVQLYQRMMAAGAEIVSDTEWDDNNRDVAECDDYFLIGDDPLEEERWSMS